MLVAIAALLLAVILFWFGFVQSHWIAPAALFSTSAPLVAALSWTYDTERIVAHLIANLALFYVAFAIGRWMGDRTPAHQSHWRPS